MPVQNGHCWYSSPRKFPHFLTSPFVEQPCTDKFSTEFVVRRQPILGVIDARHVFKVRYSTHRTCSPCLSESNQVSNRLNRSVVLLRQESDDQADQGRFLPLFIGVKLIFWAHVNEPFPLCLQLIQLILHIAEGMKSFSRPIRHAQPIPFFTGFQNFRLSRTETDEEGPP